MKLVSEEPYWLCRNGATFSVLAAAIVREELLGRKHPLADAVGFERESIHR